MFESLQRNLVAVVRRTAVPRSHERVMARAGAEIDRVEAIALSRISDAGSMRVTELADQLGVGCSTAGRHAANLADRGLVTRSPDELDRRATVVTVTGSGSFLVGRLRAAHREMLAELLSDWEDDDLALLVDLLGRLGDDLRALSEAEEALA